MAVVDKIEFYSSELASQLQLLERIRTEAVNQPKKIDTDSKFASGNPSITNTIVLYAATLDRNAKRLENSLESLESDLSELEDKADAIRGDIEDLNMLATRISATDADLNKILEKLSTLTLLASNYEATKVRVIDPPGYGYQVETCPFQDFVALPVCWVWNRSGARCIARLV